MAGEVQTVNIGGVAYSQGIVRDFGKNGDNHEVQLKDGTKLTYQTQQPEREAKVSISEDGTVIFEGLKKTNIFDVKKQDDKYHFSGCDDCIVDMNGKDKDIYSVKHRQLSNGKKQLASGIFIYGNDGDKEAGKAHSLFKRHSCLIFDGTWFW
jgi:hypothetical protein